MKYKIIIGISFFIFAYIDIYGQTLDWRYINKGVRLFKEKKYEDSEKNFLEALKVNSKSAKAYFGLGDVYLVKNNLKAAENQFYRAIQLENDNNIKSMMYHNIGYIHQYSALQYIYPKNKDLLLKAIEAYKEALRLNPKNNNARYNLMLCKFQLKKMDNPILSKDNKSSSSKQHTDESDQEQEEMQTNKLLNLAKQAEQLTKQKIDYHTRQRPSRDKNW